jgi:hypothetical protein
MFGRFVATVGLLLVSSCFRDPAPTKPSAPEPAAVGSADLPKRSALEEARDFTEFDDPWFARDSAEGKMIDYARRMCACRDRVCGEHVQADMTAWSEANRRYLEKGRQGSASATVAVPSESAAPGASMKSSHEQDVDTGNVPPEMLARMKRIGARYGLCYGAALGQ